MKTSYNIKTLIIGISTIIILCCALSHSYVIKQGFSNNTFIILMGDSVLKNDIYVKNSVTDLIMKKTKNILNVAKDNATIMDLYSQLDNIPLEYNNSNTEIFISAGGNDLLKGLTNNKINICNQFIQAIKSIKTKLNNARIYVFNIYLPANPKYLKYKTVIEEWNACLQKNSNTIGYMYTVIDLYALLTDPNDFVYDIEPSEIGSEKIANAILLI